MAARLAAFKPEYVSRLVLVAPGRLSELRKPIGPRALLFWAKDDKVTPISNARHVRQLLSNEAAFYAPPSGGHSIRHAYADAILAFATDNSVLPDLNGWKAAPKGQRGAHPEDEGVDPADDGEGARTGIIVAIVVVVLVLVCGTLAFCVCSLLEFWEGKGKYIVRHLEPPKPNVLGAEAREDEGTPLE